MSGAVLHRVAEHLYTFHCPGCGRAHTVTVYGKRNSQGATWGWNGDMVAPTFSPSLNVVGYCHSFVKDGFIQFLGDSTHELAGQTVALPAWTEDDTKYEGFGA